MTLETAASAQSRGGDAETVIASIVCRFQTNDNDKDKDDGISETYKRGREVLGSNQSWGRDLCYRDHNTDWGQRFDISGFNILARDVSSIVYEWSMDNDDEWNVGMTVLIKLQNGHEYEVGGAYYNIHRGSKSGSISLHW
ncbi:hypothetical protein [Nitrospirillum iridis]|uniref:Uncharacterized protein n=1 Tax=Nitrospirillum iridis TaxID=765888 RepID=A0A7X0EDQ9_9PROT|nr:hypothetical protein [Nitrospirillum iridis]MBB6253033.1 hypothetical protein [Nitrospirillum iridis]